MLVNIVRSTVKFLATINASSTGGGDPGLTGGGRAKEMSRGRDAVATLREFFSATIWRTSVSRLSLWGPVIHDKWTPRDEMARPNRYGHCKASAESYQQRPWRTSDDVTSDRSTTAFPEHLLKKVEAS